MVFNNDLLDCLCSMTIGAGISGVDIPVVCTSFVDDVAIVTLHKPLLHRLLQQHVYKHSTTWGYSFNLIKSHVLIFGKDQCPMKPVTGLLDNAIQERVSSGRARFFCALSIRNKYTRLPPNILSKLYWSLVIPHIHITYGLEIVAM